MSYITGPVICMNCKYEYVAVRPVEAVQGLECPKCFKYHVVEKIDVV